MAIGVCYSGPPQDAEAVLAPLKAFGPPAANMVAPMPYLALQSMFDGMPAGDYGYHQSIRTGYLPALPDEAIDVLTEHAAKAVSAQCLIEVIHLEGAVSKVPEPDTAFPGRDARFFAMFQSTWSEKKDATSHKAWTQSGWEALRPYSDGRTHPNFLDGDEPATRVTDAYGPRKTARLKDLKRELDPTNLFHLNKNIEP
jgi:FAD/FMN-containing dehydrogenase